MYLNRHLIGVELKPDLVKAVQAKIARDLRMAVSEKTGRTAFDIFRAIVAEVGI